MYVYLIILRLATFATLVEGVCTKREGRCEGVEGALGKCESQSAGHALIVNAELEESEDSEELEFWPSFDLITLTLSLFWGSAT